MRYERVREAVMSQPWAIQPAKLQAMLEFLSGNFASNELLARISADALEAKAKAADLRSKPGSVAVLPLYGMISHRAGMVDQMSGPGGTSTASFSRSLWSAVNDPNVKALVIDCDSPGGTVEGVQELADDIMRAKAKKPITAIADCQMASAAYWICSASTEIVASPSSSVGSIGVFMAHEDRSAAMDAAGVKINLISAGKYKTEGNPYSPLDDEALASLQGMVNHFYGMFIDSVAAGRGISSKKVQDKYGQGRMLPAADALKAGMVDRIATLDQVLSKMGMPSQSQSAGRASRTMEARHADAAAIFAVPHEDVAAALAATNADMECACECSPCEGGDCAACDCVDCTCENCACANATAKLVKPSGPSSLMKYRLALAGVR